MKHETKQKLLKFWFVFWLTLGTWGVLDIITDNQFAYHPFSCVAIGIMTINFIAFRWNVK